MTRRVLIAGGGVAAPEAALALRALAEERTSVELLAPVPLSSTTLAGTGGWAVYVR